MTAAVLLVWGIAASERAWGEMVTHQAPADVQDWATVAAPVGSMGGEAAATPDAVTTDPLLGSWHIDTTPMFNWGSRAIFTNLDRVRITFGPNAGLSSGFALFESAVVTTSSVGGGFYATAANDPEFAPVAAMLSDGVTGQTIYPQTGNTAVGYGGGPRTDVQLAAGASPADFAGYRLTAIELHINNFSYASPGENPNGDGLWTSYRIDRSLRFYGVPVPEPTSTLVGAFGMAIALRRRRPR